ncbi:hypothetical protein [Kitasatospora acidiphila]|uniref:hypothetical protein n=1 Tax=Kitasatospora acidiphila TaxID=2567942 RepID=UPI003C74EBAC
MPEKPDHTHVVRLRVPLVMWEAYGRIAERLNTDRSALLLDHIRADIKMHGTAADLADLERAELELTARRARKGGRPARKSAASATKETA